MFKKKKSGPVNEGGFTLVELVIVITVVSVLMLALKDMFQVKNKEQYFAQACVNTLYGKISNFIYQGITSRALNTGSTLLYPQSYKITFDTNQDGVSLNYTMPDGTTGIKDIFNLSGGISAGIEYCQSPAYNVIMLGTGKVIVEFNKGLQESENNLGSFSIKDGIGGQYVTGTVVFQLCDKSNTVCKNLSEYTIDKRNQNITNKSCMTRGLSGYCEERDK